MGVDGRATVLVAAGAAVVLTLVVGRASAQGAVGNFRCITGHNYSSNWNDFVDVNQAREHPWWYYSYKPDDSLPVRETSCGPGFDACRTEILIHEREAFTDGQQAYVPFKSAEMILTCSYVDYCYPEEKVYMFNDPNALVYHNDDHNEYTHKVTSIVECCNSEWACNIDETDAYANKYASAAAAQVSAAAVAVVLAGLFMAAQE